MFTENQFKSIAKKFHTLVDIKVYTEYNFTSVVYMTDMFGGCYACFHIDNTTGETVIDYGTPQAISVEGIEKLEEIVETRMNEMLANRDLDNIGELINSEY